MLRGSMNVYLDTVATSFTRHQLVLVVSDLKNTSMFLFFVYHCNISHHTLFFVYYKKNYTYCDLSKHVV